MMYLIGIGVLVIIIFSAGFAKGGKEEGGKQILGFIEKIWGLLKIVIFLSVSLTALHILVDAF